MPLSFDAREPVVQAAFVEIFIIAEAMAAFAIAGVREFSSSPLWNGAIDAITTAFQ